MRAYRSGSIALLLTILAASPAHARDGDDARLTAGVSAGTLGVGPTLG